MKKRLTTIIVACALALTIPFASAWAGTEGTFAPEKSAGNLITTDTSNSGITVDRDFYWAGQTLNLSDSTVGSSVLAAGEVLNVTNTAINGSLRLAGSSLSVSKVVVEDNMTLAGANLEVDQSSSTAGAFLAGAQITFDGTAQEAYLAAGDVTFNGTVNGDLHIDADNVTIGEKAVVTGTLFVETGNQPTIATGAKIGTEDITVTADEPADTTEDTDAAAGVGIGATILGIIAVGLMMLLFALLLTFILRNAVDGAAAMVKTRTAPLLVTGLVTLIVAPIAFIFLLCLIITLPIAFGLLLALSLFTFIAIPFAGASLARLVVPSMNRYGSACLGGLVLGAASMIPFVGPVVVFAASCYTVGYFVQYMWVSMDHGKNPQADTVQVTYDGAQNEGDTHPGVSFPGTPPINPL